MDIQDIERFLVKASAQNAYVKISFKKREAIYGLFVADKDYAYLKSKNFWRIVPQNQLNAYNQSKNINLARIFCGVAFSRLSLYHESFEE
jgi:hypothetical protein